MRIGRIPYINCFPVYGALDRGIVPFDGELVSGVPSELNRMMAEGILDVSVVSAVEYAREPERYLLLPDLAISCDGPVRSVLLLSRRPASALDGSRIIVSRSSMTSVALLELLFRHVWFSQPVFVPGDAETGDIQRFSDDQHEARLVIGDAALILNTAHADLYPYRYDLGLVWKEWTQLPFVFAVWVAQRTVQTSLALAARAALLASRSWGLANIALLAAEASRVSGVSASECRSYLSGLDYRLGEAHLEGLSEFFRRLVAMGSIRNHHLEFLPAA